MLEARLASGSFMISAGSLNGALRKRCARSSHAGFTAMTIDFGPPI